MITLVYFTCVGRRVGYSSHVDEKILTTPGALFIDTEGRKYEVKYYNEEDKVAFAMERSNVMEN